MLFKHFKKENLFINYSDRDLSELKIAVKGFISILDKVKISLNIQNFQQEEEIQENKE